jgi:hypothetical protein
MNEVKVWKTDRIEINEKDLDRVLRKLEIEEEMIRKAKAMIKRIKKAKNDEITEMDVNELQVTICTIFHDCFACPISVECNFRLNACEEAWNCPHCPRLPYCTWEKTPGLIQYLKGD